MSRQLGEPLHVSVALILARTVLIADGKGQNEVHQDSERYAYVAGRGSKSAFPSEDGPCLTPYGIRRFPQAWMGRSGPVPARSIRSYES
jgi:hypothetical protein